MASIDSVRWRFCLRNWSRQRLMTIRVIHVTKLESPWNCASRCQPFDPCVLRKIQRFIFVTHHAVSTSVNLVPMPRHQFLKGGHIAFLGQLHQVRLRQGRRIMVPLT